MIRLFTSYYNEQDPERKAELVTCLNKNVQNELIDIIYVIIEPDATKPIIDEKIVYVQSQRPTFSDFFKLSNLSADEDDISIIANSDIYFDESLGLTDKIHFNDLWALARWDVQKNGSVELLDRRDTNDCWIWKGKLKQVPDCDIQLGRGGSDNSICERLQRAGYVVKNPSRDIKCRHLHLSNIRHYIPAETTPKPYLLINPHHLNDNKVIRQLIEA